MAPVEPREDRTALGVAVMGLAALFFTCIDSSAKWLILAGMAPIQVVFVRYAGHFILSLLLYVPRGGLAEFQSNAPWQQLLRSTLLLCGTIFNFFALQHLPITLTTTIFFAGPIVVTLLAIPVLGEKVGLRRIIAVCFGFIGVLITIQPWGVGFHPAMFLSLAALMCASGYFIMTRKLAGIESNPTSQLWSSGIATLVLAPFGLSVWVTPTETTDLVVMILIGAFGLLGHIATTLASRLADASIIAPMIYIQLFFATAISYFVFLQSPSPWTLLGGVVIIASGLYIWRRERQKSERGVA